jgi:hypothetical protein
MGAVVSNWSSMYREICEGEEKAGQQRRHLELLEKIEFIQDVESV